MFFRYVRDKDVVNSPIGFSKSEMTIIVYPSYGAVLSDDSILCVVHLRFITINLLFDGFGYRFEIIRMQHALEGVPVNSGA